LPSAAVFPLSTVVERGAGDEVGRRSGMPRAKTRQGGHCLSGASGLRAYRKLARGRTVEGIRARTTGLMGLRSSGPRSLAPCGPVMNLDAPACPELHEHPGARRRAISRPGRESAGSRPACIRAPSALHRCARPGLGAAGAQRRASATGERARQ